MRFLLDANVLIALTDRDHVSHERATAWFIASEGKFATCPITQGALIRYILRTRTDTTVVGAKRLLADVVDIPGHEFWPDSLSFLDLPELGITGYKQVTDVYLATLAKRRRGKLATLDRALAAIHPDSAQLIG